MCVVSGANCRTCAEDGGMMSRSDSVKENYVRMTLFEDLCEMDSVRLILYLLVTRQLL